MSILTLDQARSALGWREGQNLDRNEELVGLYIPATTNVVEEWCGRMEDRSEWWVTAKSSPITTPWVAATIQSVSIRASLWRLTGWEFSAGVLTITDAGYVSGMEMIVVATDLPTPAAVTLAAQIILAQLWNADKQGRASGSARGEPTESVPVGFAVPRRAEALLRPYWRPMSP